MNCEKACVSDGGDDKPCGGGEDTGVLWRIWLGRPSGGVTVPSLHTSVTVDSRWVKGDGNWALLLFRGVLCDRDDIR